MCRDWQTLGAEIPFATRLEVQLGFGGGFGSKLQIAVARAAGASDATRGLAGQQREASLAFELRSSGSCWIAVDFESPKVDGRSHIRVLPGEASETND